MITRQYYGWLVDNGLIARGDYQRISDLCLEKNYLGIDGGTMSRKAIFQIMVQGREATAEITELITEYFQAKHNVILKQKEIVNA
jgi:hypothetical protein